MQNLLERIRRLDGGQEELDTIYTVMTDVMKAGLAQVRKERGGHRGNRGSLRRLLRREGVSIKQKLTGRSVKTQRKGDRRGGYSWGFVVYISTN